MGFLFRDMDKCEKKRKLYVLFILAAVGTLMSCVKNFSANKQENCVHVSLCKPKQGGKVNCVNLMF